MGSELVVEGSEKGNGAGWQSEPPCIARRALTSDHRQWPCGHASDQSSRLIGATPTRGSNSEWRLTVPGVRAVQREESDRRSRRRCKRTDFRERLGFAPSSWGMLDGVADVVVDRVELLLEIGDVAREPSGERLVDGLAAPVGFHADHLDDLERRRPTSSARWTLSGCRRGRACGRTRSAKRAITSASSVSVLAKRPIARAKSRIWRGLTTQERQPNAGQGRRNSGFEAASRLQYNKGDGQSLEADD